MVTVASGQGMVVHATVNVESETAVARSADGRAGIAYWLLVAIFVFAGLTGHDPWKADEAYVFGVVQHMVQSNDWLVPTLAGEPFMEKPPLFYWAAALTARALSPWLPLHDGARLASGILMLMNAWLVGAAARAWWGPDRSRHAMLVLIACFGMVVQSHSMMPDLSLLTGFALTALGFSMILRLPLCGGALIGVGAGVGFLSKGLIAPGVIGITALALPICFAQWRRSEYWQGLATGVVVSLPFCVVWPLELYLRSPALFKEWFWANNIGRFAGFSVWRLRTEHTPWLWTKTIPWFTFPGLPLALFALWRRRRNALSEPPVQYSVVAFVVLMLVLATSASAREVYAWPLLVPVAIVAASAADNLPEGAERAWIWLSCILFGTLSVAIIVVWMVLMISGAPPRWPLLLRFLPGDFAPSFEVFRAALAVALVLGAMLFLREVWRLPGRGLAISAVGLAFVWSLLMTLGTPWFDYMKSYRPLFSAMPMPAATDCIASLNLGESERAMLHYVTGRDPVRREVRPNASCSLLLIQREAQFGAPQIDRGRWQEVWQGARPGPAKERFWLFHDRRRKL